LICLIVGSKLYDITPRLDVRFGPGSNTQALLVKFSRLSYGEPSVQKELLMTICRVLVGLLVLATAPAGETAHALASDPLMTVTLLGTGTPILNFNRFGMSTLVQAGTQKFLFDAGRGEVRPRDAAFSHISLYSRGQIERATEDEIAARVKVVYDGPFIVGQDLMSFTISPQGLTRLPYDASMRQREPLP
jgi:hypothetical protein